MGAGKPRNVCDFYPRSPCGERQSLGLVGWLRVLISIHALLAESDGKSNKLAGPKLVFLSTLSLRRATTSTKKKINPANHFYPRSPCGERPKPKDLKSRRMVFLSTLSLRRATAKVHKTVGHFCAYETNFMEIASSC